MNKLLFCLLAGLLPVSVWAQNCNCKTDFDFVVNYFENNNPAFQQLKASPEAWARYQKELASLQQETQKETDNDNCLLYMEAYVGLLKDHHSAINVNLSRKDLSTPEKIESFKASPEYLAYKKLDTDTARLIHELQQKPVASIEGLYTNGSSIYFGIREVAPGEYQGIVLRKNKFLDPGHVLLELKSQGPGRYRCTYHIGLLGFNFGHITKTLGIENGNIPEFGFSKQAGPASNNLLPYEYKALDEKTNYLRLSSFNASLINELDSFYKAILPELKAKPYLVIDLRNNGGGSERAYYNLMPLIYTNPLEVDDVQVWVSADNIRRYEEAGRDSVLIARMKAATPFSFIPQTAKNINRWKLKNPSKTPLKIAVLFNRGTASSAEGMITYCMQSKKVITLGQHSGGYIGYGDVMHTNTPCGNYDIASTTTKYKRNSRYEFTGIPPQVELPAETDWVEYARKKLEEQL